MQQRPAAGKVNSGSLRHGVELDLGLGILQRPGKVMDMGPADFSVAKRVQAVAFRQEVLERFPVASPWRGDRAITATKLRRARVLKTTASVFIVLTERLNRHLGVVIGQTIGGPRRPHGRPISRVEAEEINSGNVFVPHVGSDVEFGKPV